MERELTKYLEYVMETDSLLSQQATDVIKMIFNHVELSPELKQAWKARLNVNDLCHTLFQGYVSEDIDDETQEVKETLNEYARQMLISIKKLN